MTLTSLIAQTLLHFIWQGALVAGFLALVLAACRSSSAHVRYAIAAGAMALMAVLPVATAYRLSASAEDAAFVDATARVSGRDARATRADARPRVASAPAPLPAEVASDDNPSPWRAAPIARMRATVRDWADASAPVLVAIWLSGVLVLSLRLGGGLLRVRRLTRVPRRSDTEPALPAPPPAAAFGLTLTSASRTAT